MAGRFLCQGRWVLLSSRVRVGCTLLLTDPAASARRQGDGVFAKILQLKHSLLVPAGNHWISYYLLIFFVD